MGAKSGEKLVIPSIENLGKRIDKAVKEESVDVDTILAEAVEWARKSK